MNTRLGIDLGTNSIGWAFLQTDGKQPQNILKTGVRIFSDGRDPQKGDPLAVERRIARGARTRRDRLLQRKKDLRKFLLSVSLFPTDTETQQTIKALNPYDLRVRALNEKLEPYQLGRVLIHLSQRRGFLSNRKGEKKEDKDEKKDRDALDNALKETGLTLGEYLNNRLQNQKGTRARAGEGLTTLRAHYREEFYKIKQAQQPYHTLTDADWDNIEHILFFQRELRPAQLGYCQIYYSEKLERSYRAMPSFQHFRIEQNIANLQIIDAGKNKTSLSPKQREKLREKLLAKKTMGFAAIRTLFGLDESFTFNLETDQRKHLEGEATSYLLSQKEYFGKKWHDFSLTDQDKIVSILLKEGDPEKLKNIALKDWQLSELEAQNLVEMSDTKFEAGTARFSTKALYELIAIMVDQGLSVTEAIAQIRGGYGHNRRGELELKYYGEVMPESVVPQPRSLVEAEKVYGKINNPTVHIGLNQLRKLVNEIIKDSELGLPDEIVIELARDLKLGKDAKKKLNEQNSKNEKLNKEAKDKIEKQGYAANAENILRYKLWKELNPDDCNDRKSPYSGRTIGISQLFSNQIEIEHILPLSRTLDDNYNNKTLCFVDENRMKGNHSPYEACRDRVWSFDHDDILDRVSSFPRKKRYRFELDAMERWEKYEGGFISRQLTDTQYLSKVAKRYLESIYPADGKIHVRVIPGQLTAKLRRQWGLDSILSGNAIAEKNRDDHRHHAIDAVVIACTDQGLMQRAAKGAEKDNELEFPPPFGTQDEFRNHVKEYIDPIIVSHRPDHGWQGELLQAGNYGVARNEGFHIEYKANLITEFEDTKFLKIGNKILKIVNPNLRKILESLLSESNTSEEFIEKLKSYVDGSNYWKKSKKVRFQDSKVNAITVSHPKVTKVHKKMVIPQEKLLVSFWENTCSSEPIIIIRNRMEIAQLLQQEKSRRKEKGYQNPDKFHVYEAIKNDLVAKRIVHPSAKLILTLYKKDLIKTDLGDGEKIYRITAIHEASPNERFVLREHIEAQGKDKYLKFKYIHLPKHKVRKIHITPAGKIHDSGAVF